MKIKHFNSTQKMKTCLIENHCTLRKFLGFSKLDYYLEIHFDAARNTYNEININKYKRISLSLY